jgi:hypothetical protein
VIPKWIPRLFGLSGEIMNQDRAVGITSGQRIPFGDYAARIYCDAHHKLVNELIENKPTRELITQLFAGTALLLRPEDQTRLAAWAVKTCYAQWGMVRRRRGIPVSHRTHLIETGSPHPSVFVSISRSSGDWMRTIFARTEITRNEDGRVIHVYEFVISIGQLTFKVWAPTGRQRTVGYKTPTSLAKRVWPITEQVAVWPPGRILDYDGVTELWTYDPRAGAGSRPVRGGLLNAV